ncbi:tetratricopeptide repeat protein [Methanolobus sp. WCC1]|uniref:tetratricopeptide repeat protein n=1 Tax=unclassified Methanolobus TaxID=2629569 RepID=UPI003254D7B4
MELTPEHLSKLDKLATLLKISNDCTIAFLRCNEPVLCDVIHENIKERLDNSVFIYDVRMDKNHKHLFELLKDAMQSEEYITSINSGKKVAFFVTGLDEAIKVTNNDGNSKTLLRLNIMRENFLQIPHTIVIQLNKGSFSLLLKEAPDFFAWRTTVLEFDMEKAERIISVHSIEDTDLEFLNEEELSERWYYYTNLISENEKKGKTDLYKLGYWNSQLGIIELLRAHYFEAIQHFEQALVIDRGINDRRGEEIHLGNLGLAYRDLGDVKKAIDCCKQALVISREIGDRKGEGNHLGNLGLAYRNLGDVKKAIDYHEQALAISREIEDRKGEGADLGNLAIAYNNLGDVKKAIEYYEQALAIDREIGDWRGESTDLGNLSLAYSNLGDVKKAIDYCEQALVIDREIGEHRGEGNHLSNLGTAYSDLGDIKKAIDYYKQALVVFREIGDPRGEGDLLGNLGIAYRDLGDVQKAIDYYKQALEIGKEINYPRLIKFCKEGLTELKKSQNTKD